MPGHLVHNLECDKIILSWRHHVKHDDADTHNEFKQQNKLKRRKETMENVLLMLNIDRCVTLHDANGLQITEWKFTVSKILNKDNVAKNNVTRAIQREREAKG